MASIKKESQLAFTLWKKNNPQQVHDDLPFYMVGEVVNWGVNHFQKTAEDGRSFNYGDKQVDFFDYGFDALINMGFVEHASMPVEALFLNTLGALTAESLRCWLYLVILAHMMIKNLMTVNEKKHLIRLLS